MVQVAQFDIAETKSALQHSPEFFISFFMGDELTFPVPDFHKDIFHLMTHADVKQFVCAIPRAHAKTTLAKLACVWYWLFTDYQFIIYLSNTADVAIPSTNDVIGFIESDNFRAVYGPVEWEIRRDGEGLYKFRIPGLGPDGTSKTCILRALGAGKQVRGINVEHNRPQLAIVDDLEDAENIATEALYKKLKRWFYGTFRKALDPIQNKIIQLGNIVTSPCMLDEHCNSNFWFSRRYGCLLADGTPLWADIWPVDKLREDYEEYSEAGELDTWFAEMMNLPRPPGGGLINANEITYRPAANPGDFKYGFLTVDLALSDATWAHRLCVAAHGFDEEMELWQVVEYQYGRGIDPIRLFYDYLVPMSQHWGWYHIGIESAAYQASLQHVYRHLALTEHMDFMQFYPLPAVKRKTVRFAAWAALLKQQETQLGPNVTRLMPGRYALTEGDFLCTAQLLKFDPNKKENDDDILDACAHGTTMLSMYLADVMTAIEPETAGTIQTIYQVSAV